LEGELPLSVLKVIGRNWVVEAFFLCAIIRKTTIMHPLPPLPNFKASSLASILKHPDYYNLETGVSYRNPSSVDSFSKLHHSREESAEKVKCSQGLHWRRRRRMTMIICQAALTQTGVVDNNGKTTPNSAHPFVQVEGVSYRPPGTQLNLLNNVSLSLPDKSLGLIYGRSGSGKTTLLQASFVL
jgi:ABC-type multidrug transport system fused ATPase/permease subunit